MCKDMQINILRGIKGARLDSGNFTQIPDELRIAVGRNVGKAEYYTLSHIWSKCYGDRVTCFPKVETIADELGDDTSTIKRHIKKLKDHNCIKAVPVYNYNGTNRSNLYIINPAYPEIPEGWNELYQYGLYEPRFQEYMPLENKTHKPWKDHGMNDTLGGQICTPSNYQDDTPQTQENIGGQICTPSNYRGGINEPHPGGKYAPLYNDETPITPKDEARFLAGEENNLEEDFITINKKEPAAVVEIVEYFLQNNNVSDEVIEEIDRLLQNKEIDPYLQMEIQRKITREQLGIKYEYKRKELVS